MPTPEGRIPCRTADGLSLAVRRIPSSVGPSRGAVILQHGLGANGRVFDVPQWSLARRLAAAGFDCFISELRGSGGSDRPEQGFGLDQYLEQDVPAILSAVLESTGRERVHWVGHSMGGILMMFYAMEHGDVPVERFVALGSALDYKIGVNAFTNLRHARPLAGTWLRTFPFGALGRVNAFVAGRGPCLPAEQMNFCRANVARDVMCDVLANGFESISIQLFDDLLSTFDAHGFARKQGTISYLPRTKDFNLHTCLIAGSADVQATPASIDATARLLAHVPKLEVHRLGKAHGCLEDYGHVDLVVGKHADREVWPKILGFLDA